MTRQEEIAAAARAKTTERLLETHEQGRTHLADGWLPFMWEEVMSATEAVLAERGVEYPKRYARPAAVSA